MLFLVCSVVLATGVWDCGLDAPLPMEDAVAVVYATNSRFPFKPETSKRSPYTIWPAWAGPPGAEQKEGAP